MIVKLIFGQCVLLSLPSWHGAGVDKAAIIKTAKSFADLCKYFVQLITCVKIKTYNKKIRFHLFSKNGRKQTGIRKATVLSEGGEWGVQVTVKVKLLEVMQAENNRVTRNHCMQIV